jgi:hypothetical protein
MCTIQQLMEEWEYHFAGSATQSVRGLMAKVSFNKGSSANVRLERIIIDAAGVTNHSTRVLQ